MKPPTLGKPAPQNKPLAKAYAVLFGAFLGLTLLKFSNVAIFERLVEWPANGWEWAINAWPVSLAYWLLAILAGTGVVVARWEIRGPRWLLALPLVWLGWQFIAATHTLDPELTRQTLKHFVSCVACFFLGAFCLRGDRTGKDFWVVMLCAFAVILAVGIGQHFGGLEATRRYFYLYEYEKWQAASPEQLRDYLKRINSDRIFSTLFYPNAFAGALLLWLPASLAVIWGMSERFTAAARGFLMAVVGGAALACLFWSGSKGGWLLMLLLGLVALLRLPFASRWKLALVVLVSVAGLAGFGVKYAGFFRRGATSVGARFDYWQAAVRTVVASPVFGTGPGTFAIPYGKIKRPESEMARLVHNDYLQQASDSGFVGLATFGAFVVGVLIRTRPRPGEGCGSVRFAVWLGLVGWWLQGLLEFGLYIPALAWSGFALMGWLLATAGKPFDKPETAA